MKKKLVVLDGHCINPGDLSWDRLLAAADIVVHPRTAASEALARCAGAELVMTSKTPLTAETIAALPALTYIGVIGTGYNVVDVAAAHARGVVVTNVPAYGTASVAQHAIALLLELSNRTGLHADAVRAGEWSSSPDWSFWKSPLIELAGKTLGVIGFGRIGRQTARIAHAIGMRVIAADPVETDTPDWDGFRWDSVDNVLAQSDAVSLHCPLTRANTGLINRQRLRTMKRSAFLINTSRGPLVVDQDLADALSSGEIAGAGLDVLSLEPPSAANPLFSARNCIVTPHIAWATREARGRLLDTAIDNALAFLAGAPVNTV